MSNIREFGMALGRAGKPIGYALLVTLVSPALSALAQTGSNQPGGGGSGGVDASGGILNKGLSGLQLLACRVFSWVYTFAIIVGVIFIVLAAIQYMTAGENSEQVKKAHTSLQNAIIGITVAIIAWGVPNIIASFLEVKGTDFGSACSY